MAFLPTVPLQYHRNSPSSPNTEYTGCTVRSGPASLAGLVTSSMLAIVPMYTTVPAQPSAYATHVGCRTSGNVPEKSA
ncbi:uncharacterized protein M421DRAFT_426911 [Didymella exigua CBS 183.55]|uniref:Uncharacterized protein n=1 Tax=Didymella exigua CBS 183.55 TaxID=1150837 RepID=A0A6A5R4T4_9PLEO|nr:uncharacterized protein M421DRAFT_426911 [Didymella exigua CBS 183.55]KAF1922409.1 hypothetical protein M421DRAFT_426911 [Didymella exigua CBS 183.55]